ncbi:MAG: restriction endonuclease [Prevotellaceae bacterium]|jgi:site-specific DNA-methyltransferase (adenine-specific)|nr:restriction endonuclease [Prevotellaceae bacterium]
MKPQSKLYYGDNLEVLQNNIQDESIDLCYIDPPFNSNRDYNQIYNNIGAEDRAQATAFTDTWEWDDSAIDGLKRFDLVSGDKKIPEKTKLLINSLHKILGKGSMLAYIISISQRIIEIHRVLKPTGSFYLHCDPTASHYLKLVLDSVFVENGGDFLNEITWKRYAVHSLSTKRFDAINDTIFFYTKTKGKNTFTKQFEKLSGKEMEARFPYIEIETGRRFQHAALEKNSNKSSRNEKRIIQGKEISTNLGWVWSQKTFDERIEKNPYLIYWTESGRPRYKIYTDEYLGKPVGSNWSDIPYLSAGDAERLGYPTQKPEKLLERIILASSNEKDVVLDAYCGCGTTVAVAQRLKRKWIGIDITYQSISVILKRLKENFGQKAINNIEISGIPKDIDSATALAYKKEDTARKEFEKWAVLTYSNDNAEPNDKKGADKGIDGRMYIYWDIDKEIRNVLFSVKSGHVTVAQIRDFLHVIERDKAVAGAFITLKEPTKPMLQEAKNAGTVTIPLTGQSVDKLQIVTIQQILDGARASFPLAIDPLKKAERKTEDNQLKL